MEFVLTFELTGGIKIGPKKDSALEIRKMVHKYLETKNYGKGVLKFHVVLQLLNEEQSLAFPAGHFYRPRRKEVLFAELLDLHEAFNCSLERWNQIVCETILGIAARFEEIGVKSFDFQRFRDDLEHFFKKNEWINR